MGRAPCCSKVGLNRGAWSAEEDNLLVKYVEANGEGNWRSLPKKAGLRRCGKSCRLRWLNYLRPSIKRGNITPEEEELIIRMHALLGNRWAIIAGRVPGRTDNEIKNYWNTNLSKKLASRGIICPKIHKSEKKKQSQSTQLHLETKSKEQKAQVPQVIAPNVYNPKADLKIHGLKQNEHGVLSPYTNPITMDSSNAASFTPSDAIILHVNMHCTAPADGAALDNIVEPPPIHQIHNCSNLSGDDGNQHLSSLESQLNAHNSNQCSNDGHVDDDNDEIGNMFSYILDFGRGENEIPVQNDDGWLQDQRKAAMEYQEELHWDDGVLKQGVVGEVELGTDICVNDMAAMWESCLWY